MTDPVPLTEDGRHIIVNGRKWRATDPDIPAPLRTELVKELMGARRTIRNFKHDPEVVAAARLRVQNAKVALGERGEPWWETPTAAGQRERIVSAIHALLNGRKADATICPSDIARIVGSPQWRPLMDTVRAVGVELAAANLITVTQRGEPVPDPATASGPVRFRAVPDQSNASPT